MEGGDPVSCLLPYLAWLFESASWKLDGLILATWNAVRCLILFRLDPCIPLNASPKVQVLRPRHYTFGIHKLNISATVTSGLSVRFAILRHIGSDALWHGSKLSYHRELIIAYFLIIIFGVLRSPFSMIYHDEGTSNLFPDVEYDNSSGWLGNPQPVHSIGFPSAWARLPVGNFEVCFSRDLGGELFIGTDQLTKWKG